MSRRDWTLGKRDCCCSSYRREDGKSFFLLIIQGMASLKVHVLVHECSIEVPCSRCSLILGLMMVWTGFRSGTTKLFSPRRI